MYSVFAPWDLLLSRNRITLLLSMHEPHFLWPRFKHFQMVMGNDLMSLNMIRAWASMPSIYCLFCCLSLVESFFRVWWSPYTNSKWTSSFLHSWLYRQVITLHYLYFTTGKRICDKCEFFVETLNHCLTQSEDSACFSIFNLPAKA